MNEFVNVPRETVRQVRAMLYAWGKFGLNAAARVHAEKHYKKFRATDRDMPPFDRVVEGKLEFIKMVRGVNDPVYRKYREQFIKLAPDRSREHDLRSKAPYKILVATEGKTDVKHIQAALKRFNDLGLFTDLQIDFHHDDKMGSGELYKFCSQLSRLPQPIPVVCVFDRDEGNSFLSKVTGSNWEYKDWSNNVFSLAIPIPAFRESEPEICIEMLYRDEEIKTIDENGRRLFFNTEFDSVTSFLLEDRDIIVSQLPKKNKIKKIIDDGVHHRNGKKLSLSKEGFANHILQGKDGFDSFGLDGFKPLFEEFFDIAVRGS